MKKRFDAVRFQRKVRKELSLSSFANEAWYIISMAC